MCKTGGSISLMEVCVCLVKENSFAVSKLILDGVCDFFSFCVLRMLSLFLFQEVVCMEEPERECWN